MAGLEWGCTLLGGKEEFCGFNPSRASSLPIRSSNVCTKARTAGVISDSSSGGIVSEFGLADDIMHVVSENPPCVQVSFPKQCHRGVNGYLLPLVGLRFLTIQPPDGEVQGGCKCDAHKVGHEQRRHPGNQSTRATRRSCRPFCGWARTATRAATATKGGDNYIYGRVARWLRPCRHASVAVPIGKRESTLALVRRHPRRC